MILFAVGGSALLLAAIVAGLLVLNSRGASEDVATTLRDAGCTYQHPPSQGRQHVNALPRGYKPNSTPRTSGPHAQSTIIYGTYPSTVPELNAVHNLEHGAVIIWYGPRVAQETLNQINDLYTEDPNGLIVARHPKLGDDIALVAWTQLARCSSWNEDAAKAFIEAFRGKGPERFEIGDLQPGQG